MICPTCKGGKTLLKKVQGKGCYEVVLGICDKCNGTGEIEMTNEEWFCDLSTEEKVAALVDLHKKVRMKMRTEFGGENSLLNGDYHREWLKEKHHG